MDSGLEAQNLDTRSTPSGPVLWREFGLTSPEDMGRIVGGVRPTTGILNPCASWLIKDTRGRLHGWICPIVKAPSKAWHFPIPLKEAVIDLPPTK